MVQIPQYVQQEGLAAPSRDIPNVVQPTDGGIGQALSSLGGAITNVSEQIQARQQRQASFDAKVGMDTYKEKMQQAQIELERNAPADGRGIHDALLSKRSQYAAEYLSTITDPVLRENTRKILDTSDAEYWSNQGANSEWKIGNKFSIDQTNTMWSKRQQGIAADPASVKAYVSDMEDAIDKAPNLTPAQRAEMKQKVREDGPKLAAQALTTMDPEAAHFLRTRDDNDAANPNLPTETQRIDFLTRRAASAMPGVDAGKLKSAITKHGGDVEAAFGDIADEMGVDEKDRPTFIENGMKGMGAARLISGKGGNVRSGRADGSSAGLVSRFEGFRTGAYWDVNHWRVGYGSDTVTRADGTVERVTKNTRVTRADADRDLNRRIKLTQDQIASQVGDGWNSLGDGAKAALTSVAYNYGSLPSSVVAAAKTGDGQQVAQAILGLSDHNGGVNANRRKQEAAIAAGGSLPAGNVRVADASGTGGLTANDAGPQYADGVPGAGAPGAGFVAPVFQDLPADEQLRLQASGSKAYAAAAQTQLAQGTADDILGMAGATADAAGDRKAAYAALDAIGDASLKKDVAPLIDAHFNRWEKVEKDQKEQAFGRTWTAVEEAIANGQPDVANALVIQAGLPPDETEKLQARIAKGPVQYDDPRLVQSLDAMRFSDPRQFMDIDFRKVGDLTNGTLKSYQELQAKMKEEAGKAASDQIKAQEGLMKDQAAAATSRANQVNETFAKANPIVDKYFLETGIPTDAKKMTPADAAHANFVRSTVAKELEIQQQASKTPLTITQIQDTVDAVMKTYPRNGNAPAAGSWMKPWTWGSTDQDVNMNEVLTDYGKAGLDPDQMANAIRKKGMPVNAQTLQQMLDTFNAQKAAQ